MKQYKSNPSSQAQSKLNNYNLTKKANYKQQYATIHPTILKLPPLAVIRSETIMSSPLFLCNGM